MARVEVLGLVFYGGAVGGSVGAGVLVRVCTGSGGSVGHTRSILLAVLPLIKYCHTRRLLSGIYSCLLYGKAVEIPDYDTRE